MTSASGTHWALGLETRSQALLSDGAEADHLYRASVAHFCRTGNAWIWLEATCSTASGYDGNVVASKHESSCGPPTAHRMLEAMGANAFAERARRELEATGATARKRGVFTNNSELTVQEARIARMARDGLSNPDIGTRLFISTHTVQYHLRKVFAKLGVSSRSQLDRVLPHDREPTEIP